MSDGTTYDARVYQTEVYKGRKVTTYWVRWKVGHKLRPAPRRGLGRTAHSQCNA